MLTQDIKDRVEEKILECLDRAERFYKKVFPMIPIHYTLKNSFGGCFKYCVNLQIEKMNIYFNPVLLLENGDNFINHTVVHEIAHYIQRVIYPTSTVHGKEWKYIMENVLCGEAKIHHSYNTANVLKKKNRHLWDCGCKVHLLTTIMHNKFLAMQANGNFNFRCIICKSRNFVYRGSEKV